MASKNSDARSEARNLFALIGGNGDIVDSIRELIAVPPWIEDALGLYARRFPEDAPAIEKVLRFRTCVREEFDRLVRESVSPLPSDLAAQIERGESLRRRALEWAQCLRLVNSFA